MFSLFVAYMFRTAVIFPGAGFNCRFLAHAKMSYSVQCSSYDVNEVKW